MKNNNKEINQEIQALIEGSISVTQANFHTAVNNGDRIPESEFNTSSPKASRQVQMWLTGLGLLCLHKDEYFMVPAANIIRVTLCQ